MGAQQSSAHRGIKLRRRSATAAAVTSEELNNAGVEIAKAVAAITMMQQEGELQKVGGSDGTEARQSATRSIAIEMPPWEIVAQLGEADWVALRAWMESGWRCRKCGHIRDDHNDHSKAIRLLQKCGVPVPKPRSTTGVGGPSGGSPSGVSASPRFLSPTPSNTSSRMGASASAANVVGYASESPDHQLGYLSDSRSGGSSSSSPSHPKSRSARFGGLGSLFESRGDSSPRFRGDCAGAHSPFSSGSDSGRVPKRTLSADMQTLKNLDAMELVPGDAREVQTTSVLHKKILAAVARAQQVYFIDKEPNGTLVFDYLLSALLDITESPYGFIHSALLKADGTPYLKSHAMSNTAWTKELRAWYAANVHKGLVFTNMNTLHGSIVLTGQPVITNDAPKHPHARGVPPGHPSIDKFLGVPLYTGSEMIGVIGVANTDRERGYTEQLVKELEPLTITIAQMIYAVNERKRRKEAELQFAAVTAVAKEGILCLSHSGHVTSMNNSAQVMFGFAAAGSREEPSLPPNTQIAHIIPEVDGRPDYLQHRLEHRGEHVHIGKGMRRDGSYFSIEVSISKGSYDSVFYVMVIRDKTEQQEAETKLQESEDCWKFALSGSDVGVWDWKIRTSALTLSDHWKAMLGYEPQEFKDSTIATWETLLHPDDVATAYIDLKAHLDGLTDVFQHEQRLRCKDGSYRWMLHRGRCVSRGPFGEPIHFVGTHADVTERKQVHGAIVAASEATRKLRAAEAGLFALCEHYLCPSIHSVLEGVLELKSRDLPPSDIALIEQISEGGRIISDRVSTALDSDLVMSDGMVVTTGLISVPEVTEMAAEAMDSAAESKGLEMIIDQSPDAPAYVLADSKRMVQILVGVLSLAVRSTPRGFIRLRVFEERGGTAERQTLVCAVESSAPGTAMVEAFERDDSYVPVCKKLAAAMGGSLFPIVEPNRMPAIALKLPVNTTDPAFARAVVPRASLPVVVEAPLKQSRVLIVGSMPVTTAAINKQLHAWHIPHTTCNATAEDAFLSLYPAHALPQVMLAAGSAPPPLFKDGSPRTGLSLEYDIIIIDCKDHYLGGEVGSGEADSALVPVLEILAKDKVGVVLLLRDPAVADRHTRDALAAAADWGGKPPVLLAKPMVRPRDLLEALEDALISLPGNEHVLSEKRMELHGVMDKDKAAAQELVAKAKASIQTALAGGKLTGRMIYADHNRADLKVTEQLANAMGVTMHMAIDMTEALKIMKANDFDVFLFNCELVGSEAQQAMHAFRAELGSRMPAVIIGLCASLDDTRKVQLKAAGLSDVFAKPTPVGDIEKVLRAALPKA